MHEQLRLWTIMEHSVSQSSHQIIPLHNLSHVSTTTWQKHPRNIDRTAERKEITISAFHYMAPSIKLMSCVVWLKQQQKQRQRKKKLKNKGQQNEYKIFRSTTIIKSIDTLNCLFTALKTFTNTNITSNNSKSENPTTNFCCSTSSSSYLFFLCHFFVCFFCTFLCKQLVELFFLFMFSFLFRAHFFSLCDVI